MNGPEDKPRAQAACLRAMPDQVFRHVGLGNFKVWSIHTVPCYHVSLQLKGSLATQADALNNGSSSEVSGGAHLFPWHQSEACPDQALPARHVRRWGMTCLLGARGFDIRKWSYEGQQVIERLLQ